MSARRHATAVMAVVVVAGLALVLGRGGVATLGEYAPVRLADAVRHRLAGPAPGGLPAVLEHHLHATPGVPGIALSATSPARGVRFRGVVGRRSFGGPALRVGDEFRTASVTKPFTAAAVLRLVEDGRLALDDPVGPLLPAELPERLRPVAPRITVRQLLQHTSGLRDYGTDPRWLATVALSPQRRWTAAALVDAGLSGGALDRNAGRAFHYSDTGYVLLGLLLERVTRRPLASALRELLPLDALPATYLEGAERPARPAARAHQYAGPLDLTGFDPSYDAFGGGGLVADAADLDAFGRKLLTGRLLRRPTTQRALLRTVPAGPGRRYGLGIGRRRLAGEDVWFHEGFSGAFLAYVPRLDLSVGGSVNQSRGDAGGLLAAVIRRVGGTAVRPSLGARPRTRAAGFLPGRELEAQPRSAALRLVGDELAALGPGEVTGDRQP